ncbi:hypothetical protein EAS68_12045 [Legionella jordanis]|uniref:hypothetical protein n=1 Tax=Legionella jordanis TaxID=456 RepID=UPI000EFF17A5|nr:hypothetical protein [Legionella jordanis]RMX15583.1 hypothetical protein EAS68_12045 [Legionella jordanis]
MANTSKPREVDFPGTKIQQNIPQTTQDNSYLKLSTKDKKQVNLSSSQLEAWFASLKTKELDPGATKTVDKAEAPSLTTQYLGRYGLKTAQDVIDFLKSPAGRTVQALIGDRLIEIALLEKNLQQIRQDSEIRRHRALAALLLGLLYKKQARAKERRAENDKETKRLLDQQREITHSANAADAAHSYAAYAQSLAVLQETLEHKIKESEELEEELERLEKEEHKIEQRYHNFQNSLDSLDFLQEFLEAHGTERQYNVLEKLSQEINSLHAHLDNEQEFDKETIQLFQERKNFLQNQQQFLLNFRAMSPAMMLEQRIDSLNHTLEGQAEEIARLLSVRGDRQTVEQAETEAMNLLQKHNGLHVQVAGLQDMLSVIKGEKLLFDNDGRIVTSFAQAAFVMSQKQAKEYKILYKDGKHYLLTPNQDPDQFDNLKREEKEQAEKSYNRLRPDICNLKHLIHHNKALEFHDHQKKKDSLSQRSEQMQSEILLISTQMNQLQDAQQALSLVLKRGHTPGSQPDITPKSAPTPKPNLRKIVSPSQVGDSMTQSYRHILLLMKMNPTPQSLDRLQNMFRGPDGQVPTSVQNILASIRVGKPIPQQTMDNLLKNMDRLAARKPIGPVSSKVLQAPEEHSAPNPFSIKPKMTPF